jgi:hypothetical protein
VVKGIERREEVVWKETRGIEREGEGQVRTGNEADGVFFNVSARADSKWLRTSVLRYHLSGSPFLLANRAERKCDIDSQRGHLLAHGAKPEM